MVRHKISQVVIDQKNQYSEFKELFISLVNNYKSAYKTHIFSYKCVTNKSSKLKQTLDLYKEILKSDYNEAKKLPYVNEWFRLNEEAAAELEKELEEELK